MKTLRVTMPNGELWDVPAKIICHDRAKYYSDKEGKEKYQEEFDYAMKNNDEILDWASNNMNWDDVKKYAKKATVNEQPETDYQEGWINGDREIVEDKNET